jgi:hypothetical protein
VRWRISPDVSGVDSRFGRISHLWVYKGLRCPLSGSRQTSPTGQRPWTPFGSGGVNVDNDRLTLALFLPLSRFKRFFNSTRHLFIKDDYNPGSRILLARR